MVLAMYMDRFGAKERTVFELTLLVVGQHTVMAATRPDAHFITGIMGLITGLQKVVEFSPRPATATPLESPLVAERTLVLLIRLISLRRQTSSLVIGGFHHIHVMGHYQV